MPTTYAGRRFLTNQFTIFIQRSKNFVPVTPKSSAVQTFSTMPLAVNRSSFSMGTTGHRQNDQTGACHANLATGRRIHFSSGNSFSLAHIHRVSSLSAGLNSSLYPHSTHHLQHHQSYSTPGKLPASAAVLTSGNSSSAGDTDVEGTAPLRRRVSGCPQSHAHKTMLHTCAPRIRKNVLCVFMSCTLKQPHMQTDFCQQFAAQLSSLCMPDFCVCLFHFPVFMHLV